MNINDILKSRNITTVAKKAKTNEFCSPCPKCGGNDRFVIWPDENRWYCRQCDEGGNLVNFFMIIDGMNELEALEQYFICQGKNATDAADAARLAIKKQAGDPQRTYTAIRREKKAATQSKKSSKVDAQAWLEKAAALVEWAHKQLLNNQEQLSWLQNERGLTLETVKRCKLGWNPSDLYRDRNEWGLTESLHKVTGKPKKLWIPAGLIIPGYDATGNLARVKIRTGGAIKYVLLSGSEIGAAFYGDRSLQAFAVVESELDAILLYQLAPDLVCPLSSGSAAIKPDTAALELIGGHMCLLMFDADDAGVKAAVNWHNLTSSKLWIIPAKYGKDVTEAHKNGVDVRQIVEAGLKGKEPLARRELTADEQTQLINKAYERQCNRPDPQLSALIGEMEAADGNNVEFMRVLNKINIFFAQG